MSIGKMCVTSSVFDILAILQANKDNSEINVRKAQNKLYDLYHGTMQLLIRKTIDCPFIAEEIEMDGWDRIFRKIELYTFQGSLEGWIRKIMKNAVCNAIKADDRIKIIHGKGWGRNIGLENFNIVRESSIAPIDNIDYKRYERMVASMSNMTGKVFRAFLSGMTHVQIAAEFGIAEGTSKWHVSQGKFILQKLIQRN